MSAFDHERLDVYQVAISLIVLIDEIVERFPRGRAYLADQLVSMLTKMAEGQIESGTVTGTFTFTIGKVVNFRLSNNTGYL